MIEISTVPWLEYIFQISERCLDNKWVKIGLQDFSPTTHNGHVKLIKRAMNQNDCVENVNFDATNYLQQVKKSCED